MSESRLNLSPSLIANAVNVDLGKRKITFRTTKDAAILAIGLSIILFFASLLLTSDIPLTTILQVVFLLSSSLTFLVTLSYLRSVPQYKLNKKSTIQNIGFCTLLDSIILGFSLSYIFQDMSPNMVGHMTIPFLIAIALSLVQFAFWKKHLDQSSRALHYSIVKSGTNLSERAQTLLEVDEIGRTQFKPQVERANILILTMRVLVIALAIILIPLVS